MDEFIARTFAAVSLGVCAGLLGDTFLQSITIGLLLYITILGFIHAEKHR